MKRIVFFDIDGTLISEDKNAYLPESTLEAISLARKNDCYMYINTGRTLCSIEKRILDIGFDGYICGCGTYIEHQGESIFYHKTSDEVCRFIEDSMKKSGVVPVYEGKEALYYDEKFKSDKIIAGFRNEFLRNKVPFISSAENPDFSFDKFIAWTDYCPDYDSQLFTSAVSRYYTMIDRGNGLFENVPKGFSKATGIYKILEVLGVDIKNAYAVGDSMNDLSMLQAVPNSIAMGQGTSIHKYASYVTDDIYNDGIWNALKHFELI